MNLDPTDVARRLPVWKALSDLFLDTELQPADYRYVARCLMESEFSSVEIQEILWNEVFPALGDNLRIGTGEWASFSEEWLRVRIPGVLNGSEPAMGSYGLITIDQTRIIISDAWAELRKFLPA